jgi:hypothetical protein
MSFTDSAAELLDRAEASLGSLIADALRARAYSEIGDIAAAAEAVAAISVGRRRDGKRSAPVSGSLEASPPPHPETPRAATEPSWMRPKTS